jgi:hypothetical protein|tara:strand:- start:994 stop:1290 length:297 start_codon:yes stop_codon:yes gene_type:complete
MVKLHFKTTDEFEGLFKGRKLSVTRSIIQGIEEAMQGNKRTANLFEVTFEEAEMAYEISLPQSQWVNALDSCLEDLHSRNLSDEEIDCWKILEAAKCW